MADDGLVINGVTLWGDAIAPDDDEIGYGPLRLTVPAKEGKANTLLADHLFMPSLLLAECIELGSLPVADRSLLELGAGCGLPSLFAAMADPPPRVVVATEYPDNTILGNLEANIQRNQQLLHSNCTLVASGYSWGGDPVRVLNLLDKPASKFDVLILSDLLHFESSHTDILQSVDFFLKKAVTSRVYVAVADYTKPDVCERFLNQARALGILWEENIVTPGWKSSFHTTKWTREELAIRKSVCRWWSGFWQPSLVE